VLRNDGIDIKYGGIDSETGLLRPLVVVVNAVRSLSEMRSATTREQPETQLGRYNTLISLDSINPDLPNAYVPKAHIYKCIINSLPPILGPEARYYSHSSHQRRQPPCIPNDPLLQSLTVPMARHNGADCSECTAR
jgi:hypothetical protein